MNVRSVKFEENTNIGYAIFTTSCKRESTAISRFEKALSDYDSCFTESMLKAFMSIKPCGYVDGSLAWSGSSVINEEYEMHITYLDGTYSLTIYFLPALLKKDTTDTTEDTTDTTEDTTDTTEDTTDTTEDTNEIIKKSRLSLINGKVYLSCNKIGDNYFECFYYFFRDGSIVRTGVEDFSLERLKSCTKLYNVRVYNGFVSSGLSGRRYTDSTNLYILADKFVTMSSLSHYIVDNDEIFSFARLERVYSGFAKNLFQFSSAWSEFISRIEEYPEKTEDTTDTTEDTTDTTEDTTYTTEDTTDTTEDTTDTTEDTTDTTEDTTDTTEDNSKYTVALGFLDDIPVTCLSFNWCHAPFDSIKACYNCAFNRSCDTVIKYTFLSEKMPF